ncbi:Bromodomain-containing protein [Aureobasidium namibiae CBS 147.97]|uniref:Bromodomain-containing protein n=1 Tax=Aureobasidium namibiae CBS 147.97 TaxID=1043004 RepID=A0A074WPM9_9PEZI|nr:Bromodomain-containing protein [Aureobasidium namibiae CBS 147.97]KEQ75088.1 Bromodomain-containing protein [Aureobasidium namibiae CBS 147.97]
MSSWKRDRNYESEDGFDTMPSTSKRARLASADPSGSICHRAEQSDMVREYLLITWSRPMTEQQKSFLTKKMEELMTLKSAADFLEPRTGKDVPVYISKIKGPTDLSTIRNLLDTGGYPSVADLLIDFTTMIHNVIWINGCKRHDPAPARRFLKCFCDRLKQCPIGPYGKPLTAYTRDDMRLMASDVTDGPTKVSTLSPEKSKVASINDSVQNELVKHSLA